MIKEERKELRDEMERVYGIYLREDDELLPIIHFITEASKLAELNTSESKKLLEKMKTSSDEMIAAHSTEFKNLLVNSGQMLSKATSESKEMIITTKKSLEGLPKMVQDFKNTIASLKIPEQIIIKRISFDESTMSFLWKYFTLSVFIIILTISISAFWIYNTNKEMAELKDKYKTESYEWLLKYYNKMKKVAPEVTKKFKEENPIPISSSRN